MTTLYYNGPLYVTFLWNLAYAWDMLFTSVEIYGKNAACYMVQYDIHVHTVQ